MSQDTALLVMAAGVAGMLLGVALCAKALILFNKQIVLLNERIELQKSHVHLMDYRAACWKARCEELRYVSLLLERGIVVPPLISRDGSPCTFTTIDELTK